MLLHFFWYQKVYFCEIKSSFPSNSPEYLGQFVGFNQHVGHTRTYAVLDPKTSKVLYCSEVCPADNASAPNLCADNWGDDNPNGDHEIIRSMIDGNIEDKASKPLKIINIDKLIGCTFKMPNQDGELCKATITKAVYNFEKSLLKDPLHAKFKASLQSKKSKYDEMISYNQLLEHLEKSEHQLLLWELDKIIAHQDPLNNHDHNYQVSKYNITVQWSNGEKTDEPLSVIALDSPLLVLCTPKKKGSYIYWDGSKSTDLPNNKERCSLM